MRSGSGGSVAAFRSCGVTFWKRACRAFIVAVMTDRDELIALIARLEKEADQADALDEDARERLLALAERLRKTAADEEAGLERYEIEDALRDALTEFEMSHPRLTAILGNIAAALSSLGI